MLGKKRLKKVTKNQSVEEEEENDADEVAKASVAPKRSVEREKQQRGGASKKLSRESSKNTNSIYSILGSLSWVLKVV